MAGKLAPVPGQFPTINDWVNQLNSILPEVRNLDLYTDRG